MAGTYVASAVPVFLVTTPSERGGGGGYNGGIFWVEVGDVESGMDVLAHEAIHVITASRRPDMESVAASCGNGLDAETIGEGFTYAIAPGLLHRERGDALLEQVAEARRRATPMTDPALRGMRLGLALRPTVESALSHSENFDVVVSKVCDAWRSVTAEEWP
jgi:hypothetical protein